MNRTGDASFSKVIPPDAAPRRALLRALAAVVLFFVAAGGTAAAAHLHARAAIFPQTSQTTLTPLQREIEKQRARLSSGDVEERREAVMRLGAMARADSSRAALAALKDASVIVRATAARAVLFLPAVEAAAALLPLLAAKVELVRRETAYALVQTRSRTAVEALATALARDKEAGVRGAAAVALGQIGDEAATPVLTEAIGRRIARTGFLNRITFRRTEENEFVRRSAAVALGQIKSRAAVPALIAALANERAGDDVRREAARALGLIGDPAAIPTLRAALAARDPYLLEIAAEALRKLEPGKVG
ncbi:MAG TPA: HEAT repeat domain-containing protein [Pyrinomonadaceae bacterium]|nr:HEAT repeat domain-containing protein [Pyrinomonadaceae bacterium]